MLKIFDLTGKEVYSHVGRPSLPSVGQMSGGHLSQTVSCQGGAYFTQDVNCFAFAKGMYVVSFQTEKEKLVKKFVKE